MTQLTEYTKAAEDLPIEAFLGQISYFTISENDVNLEDARAALEGLGLRTSTLRKRLRAIDAFKKSVNEVAVKFDKAGDEHHSILVRPVGQDAETSHRHIVLERAIYKTGSRRKLLYDVVATVVYDRAENQITVTRMEPLGYSFTEAETLWLDARLNGLEERFEHWCTHLDAHAVRTFVREYMYLLGGISIRPNGGFYFVQQKHAEELEKLRQFVHTLGSKFHTIPLLDIVEQRNMLHEAFEDEIVEQVSQMSAEIAKILADPKRTITPETFEHYATSAAELIAKTDDYADLLDRSLTKAKDQADVFKIQTLTLTSRIKEPKRKKIRSE